jgi:glycosyltransferase involved in cell wall biosynthesis
MKKNVSVVMCTYNGAKYLREQLDSIVHQTYPLHEVLVQDDGSTDETAAIVAEYVKDYPFVR